MATCSLSSKYKGFPAHLLNIPTLSKLKYRYNTLGNKLLALVILQKNARIWGEECNLLFNQERCFSLGSEIFPCDIIALVQYKFLKIINLHCIYPKNQTRSTDVYMTACTP